MGRCLSNTRAHKDILTDFCLFFLLSFDEKKKNPQKNYRANLHICAIRIAPVQSVILTSNSLERKIGWLMLLFGAKADANTRTEVQRSFHPITQQCYPVLYSAVLQSFNANPNETIPFWHAGGRDSLIGLHHL